MRLLCAVLKLLTHRMGRRIDQFDAWLGGDE